MELYGTYENLRPKIFNETGTRSLFQINISGHSQVAYEKKMYTKVTEKNIMMIVQQKEHNGVLFGEMFALSLANS